MMKPLMLATLLIGWSSTAPLAAQIDTPEGCTPRLTIEKTQCTATTVFDCGEEIHEYTYSRGELMGIHVFNPDWSLDRFEIADSRQRMDIEATPGEEITLQRLLTGEPIQVEQQASLTLGRMGGRAYRMSVTGGLSDERIEISGQTFRTGQLERVLIPVKGQNRISFTFDIYAATGTDLFFEGSHTRQTLGSDPELIEQNPIALRYADDPGFLSDGTGADCDS